MRRIWWRFVSLVAVVAVLPFVAGGVGSPAVSAGARAAAGQPIAAAEDDPVWSLVEIRQVQKSFNPGDSVTVTDLAADARGGEFKVLARSHMCDGLARMRFVWRFDNAVPQYRRGDILAATLNGEVLEATGNCQTWLPGLTNYGLSWSSGTIPYWFSPPESAAIDARIEQMWDPGAGGPPFAAHQRLQVNTRDVGSAHWGDKPRDWFSVSMTGPGGYVDIVYIYDLTAPGPLVGTVPPPPSPLPACGQWDVTGVWQVRQGVYTPTFVLQQTGTAVTGQMLLSQSDADRAGMTATVYRLDGTLVGSRLDVVSSGPPRRDGSTVRGEYIGTVEAGRIVDGITIDLNTGGSVNWSATGASRCAE